MAVTVKGSANSSNQNVISPYVLTVPSGLSAGDVTFAAIAWSGGSAIAFPAGWTLVPELSTATFAVAYRAWQSGDPSTINITHTAGVNFWGTGTAVAYSGLDTASPVDAAAMHVYITQVAGTDYRAPKVVPKYKSGRVLTLYATPSNSNSGTAPPALAGSTLILSNTPGPTVAAYDTALDPDVEMPAASITWDSRASPRLGASIVLKAQGASASVLTDAAPFFGGLRWANASAVSYAPDLDVLGVRDGDLVLIGVYSTGTLTAPSGYTAVHTVAGVGAVYQRTWRTGDTKTPSVGISPQTWHTSTACIVRKRRSDASDPAIDVSGGNSATSTASTPSLTPSDANGILVALFGVGSSSGTSFTATPSGLTIPASNASGPSLLVGWKQPAGSPTGQHTATVALSATMMATGIVVKSSVAAVASSLRQKPRPWQFGSRRGNSYKL